MVLPSGGDEVGKSAVVFGDEEGDLLLTLGEML